MVRKRGKKTPAKARETTLRERAELRRMTRDILRLKRSIATGAFELGHLLNDIQRRELWRSGGYETFEDYVTRGAQFGTSRASAYRYMSIAETFGSKDVRALGAEKLALVVAHMHATGEDDLPEDVANLTIEVPGKDGKLTKKTVAEASKRDLQKATRHANRRKHEQVLEALPGVELARRVLAASNRALDGTELEKTKVVIVPGKGEPKLGIHNMTLRNFWRTLLVIARATRHLRPRKKKKEKKS